MEDKRSYAQLTEDMAVAAQQVSAGVLYRHYKNQHLYKVTGFGILESTNEVAVLYQPQEEGSDLTFVRPVSEWLQLMENGGRSLPRFEKIDS